MDLPRIPLCWAIEPHFAMLAKNGLDHLTMAYIILLGFHGTSNQIIIESKYENDSIGSVAGCKDPGIPHFMPQNSQSVA